MTISISTAAGLHAAAVGRGAVTATVSLLVALIAAPCMAHHATAPHYDFNNTTTIEGQVTSVFWRNPHVRLTLDVTGEDGEVEGWDVEAGSVNALERVGFGPDTIAVGDRVRVSDNIP